MRTEVLVLLVMLLEALILLVFPMLVMSFLVSLCAMVLYDQLRDGSGN